MKFIVELVVIYLAALGFTIGDWIKGRWKKEDDECW